MTGKPTVAPSLRCMRNRVPIFCLLPLLITSCAPLRTSPHDEKHQWELKLHEVQTHLDDLKHDINCFQTELQIIDGKIRYYENSLVALKEQDLGKQRDHLEQIGKELRLLTQKWSSLEQVRTGEKEELSQLAIHANETHMALSQFKGRLQELEQSIIVQNRRFEELGKIKSSLEAVAKSLKTTTPKSHKVKSGETLEKIATLYHTKVDRIKKINNLSIDLIVLDQQL